MAAPHWWCKTLLFCQLRTKFFLKEVRFFFLKSNITCRRGKKRGDSVKENFILFFFKRKKEEEEDSWCQILIGVFVTNLNFSSSGLVDVKLFCSGLFKS